MPTTKNRTDYPKNFTDAELGLKRDKESGALLMTGVKKRKDMIATLANAEYTRAQIADRLEILYQEVYQYCKQDPSLFEKTKARPANRVATTRAQQAS